MKNYLRFFGLLFQHQNLTEGGSILRHGRWWLRRRRESHFGRGRQVRLEWSFGGSHRWLGAEISLFGGDSRTDIIFSIGGWFFAFYLTLDGWLPARYGWPRHSWSHDTGIRLHGDLFWVQLHYAGADCFSCGGWKGLSWSCFLLDALLGQSRYSEKVLYEGRMELQLPEDQYEIQGQLVEARWKRPRWPVPQILRRAHLECAAGIPTPGKGESSWDLDERQTFSFVCPAETIAEGVEKLQASVELDRRRHGEEGWRPAAAGSAIRR